MSFSITPDRLFTRVGVNLSLLDRAKGKCGRECDLAHAASLRRKTTTPISTVSVSGPAWLQLQRVFPRMRQGSAIPCGVPRKLGSPARNVKQYRCGNRRVLLHADDPHRVAALAGSRPVSFRIGTQAGRRAPRKLRVRTQGNRRAAYDTDGSTRARHHPIDSVLHSDSSPRKRWAANLARSAKVARSGS